MSRIFSEYLDTVEMIIRTKLNPEIKDKPELRDEVLRRVKVALAPKTRKGGKNG